MNDKASKILKNIETRKIKPKSRWVFLLKDYFIWGLFGLTTLIGAGAISVIIFIINDNDWDIYKYLNKSFLAYFLVLMPYFWIIILFLLSFLAYFNYRHTRKGYLLNPIVVISGSIVASIVLGWLFFANGFGEKIDKVFSQKVPYYKNTESYKLNFWSHPEKGLLSGEITQINNRNSFLINDFNNKEWEIEGKSIVWKKGVNLKIGEKVKIIGKLNKKNDNFYAQEVRPWGCGCSLCENNKQNSKNDSCKNMNIKGHSSEGKTSCNYN